MLRIGDIISFGKYRQNNFENSTPIQWIVIDIKNGKALLLSRFVLDAKSYHFQYEETIWKNCSLRAWLNTEFYNTAFTETEKLKICQTELNNDDSGECILYEIEHDPIYPNCKHRITVSANIKNEPTQDNVFLLSSKELIKYQDILKKRLDTMECVPTDFALNQGVSTRFIHSIDKMGIFRYDGILVCDKWWLRNRINEGDSVACVSNGFVSEFPVFFDESVLSGVRPAIVVLSMDTIRETFSKLDQHVLFLKGKKYKIHYCEQYGDVRLYINNSDIFNSLTENFISECDFEKFIDCFPYATPNTLQELKLIYYFSKKVGTFEPKVLLPKFDEDYILKMYKLVHLIETASK